ncbi:unnamed protein product, partial [Symbiodinium pilosum]
GAVPPSPAKQRYRPSGAIPAGVAASALASGKAAQLRPRGSSRTSCFAIRSVEALGAMTELLLRLRSSEPPIREEMLREESEKGLKAICAGLGLKRIGGSRAELLDRIEEALLKEDAFYEASSPVLRIIEVMGGLKDAGRAVEFLSEKYRVVDL